jgi:4-hydroxybenzoate polyprenyltransferase
MPATLTSAPATSVPLCVDLDGTLIKSDVLWESLMLLLKRNPFFLLALPVWLLRGRAAMKQQIAKRTELNPANLPYHGPFLEYLKEERGKGRKIILATAADVRLAQAVADYVGLFDGVVASDGQTNLRGKNKGRTLSERYGRKSFDYAGNSTVDLPVWEESRQAIVVNANESLAQRARNLTEVSHVFNGSQSHASAFLKAIRPHQWVKNFIIFVPLVTSHSFNNAKLVTLAVLAIISFSACASGVYMLNDLLDLEADRQHATKKSRPFASGQLPLPVGLIMAPMALALSVAIAAFISRNFFLVLAVYFLLTTSYSWRLKQIALLDVFVLAGLYTIRLIAGHAATGIAYSSWLLAFSMFIFLSLALAKRFTELNLLRRQNKRDSKGRGYTSDDLEMVAMLGIASGFLSVLVMALYVNSEEVKIIYKYPILLLLVCPLLMYWISRVWLIAHRGQMHDDPTVFALKDPVSYAIGVLTVGILWLATGHYILPF